jgi:hypothetical protein
MSEVRFVDETPFGFGWISPEPAFMQRCSQALVAGGGVWLIDPVEGEGVDERIRALGEARGVLVLIKRHQRDASVFAARLGVSVRTAPDLGDLPFEVVLLGQGEVALWCAEHDTLVVAEALGSVQYMRAPAERVGVHPFRRLTPPRRLARFAPQHLLFGHGEGLHGAEAAAALHDTLAHARRRTPAWLWSGIRAHLLKRR